MKIEGREITTEDNYLDPVTYVPIHAGGNPEHPDCRRGVILSVAEGLGVRVLYCRSRTCQLTDAEDLVWG